MKAEDTNKQTLAEGGYCRKARPFCFCEVGFPYEYQCERCRDTRPKDDDRDWCFYGGFCWTNAELREQTKKREQQ